MIRKLIPLALLLTLALPTGAQALTRARAQRAIESRVRQQYYSRSRGVLASCRKLTRTYFSCSYSTQISQQEAMDCGANAGLTGDDPSRVCPFERVGSGTVKQYRYGLLVRVSRPRNDYLF